eukprot:15375537-Alexandrium_andersonii.AAC.1
MPDPVAPGANSPRRMASRIPARVRKAAAQASLEYSRDVLPLGLTWYPSCLRMDPPAPNLLTRDSK